MDPLWRRTWYVKRRGRRWCVIRGDAVMASSLHATKDEALARALELAKRVGGRVRIKNQRGTLEAEFDLAIEREVRS